MTDLQDNNRRVSQRSFSKTQKGKGLCRSPARALTLWTKADASKRHEVTSQNTTKLRQLNGVFQRQIWRNKKIKNIIDSGKMKHRCRI